MKRILTLISLIVLFGALKSKAQSTNDLLQLLTQKGEISRSEADSLKSIYAAKQMILDIKEDSFPLKLGRLLRLSGYTQARYDYFQQAGKNSGFTIKRARLDFQGDFSTHWNYRILMDFVGSTGATGTAPTGGSLISPNLLDAFISYKPFDFLKITAGQFIIPFSAENLVADRNLETIDRSQAVNALVARKGDVSNGLVDSIGNQNGRDIGLQISGSLGRVQNRFLFDYYFAILNGAGINTVDNNISKDLVAHLVAHPLKVLDLGVSYYNGYDRFTTSPSKNQERIRWGAEANLNVSLLSARAEYIRGQDGNTNPITHEGWYAQAAYFFWPRHLQGVFKIDAYNPNINNTKNTQESTYYIFGFNYFFNVWTKFQLNYSRRTETPSVNNDVLNVQLQLGF